MGGNTRLEDCRIETAKHSSLCVFCVLVFSLVWNLENLSWSEFWIEIWSDCDISSSVSSSLHFSLCLGPFVPELSLYLCQDWLWVTFVLVPSQYRHSSA